jgi:hypothetical protein
MAVTSAVIKSAERGDIVRYKFSDKSILRSDEILSKSVDYNYVYIKGIIKDKIFAISKDEVVEIIKTKKETV